MSHISCATALKHSAKIIPRLFRLSRNATGIKLSCHDSFILCRVCFQVRVRFQRQDSSHSLTSRASSRNKRDEKRRERHVTTGDDVVLPFPQEVSQTVHEKHDMTLETTKSTTADLDLDLDADIDLDPVTLTLTFVHRTRIIQRGYSKQRTPSAKVSVTLRRSL